MGCNARDTVLKAKMRFVKMKIEAYTDDDGHMNPEDEQDVMTTASPMEMWIGDKKLDDISIIREHFPSSPVGGAVEVKITPPSKMSEMMLLFLNTGAFKMARMARSGTRWSSMPSRFQMRKRRGE